MMKFIIDHIDPFGQGVFKSGKDIYFIPKTLPGEKGSFKVLKKSKGVHFCELISVENPSELRVKPECTHFSKCNGCHYLHTNYQSELNFKKGSFEKLLKQLTIPTPD